jgi:two-component system, NarL family, sensor kinase
MHSTFRKLLLVNLLVVFIPFFGNAQTHKLDSLRNRFQHASNETERKKTVMAICDQTYSLSADSLLKYLNIGQQLFPTASKEYIRLKNYYCFYLFKNGKIKEGLELNDSLIQNTIDKKNIDELGMDILAARCSGLIRNGENKEAIEQCFDMLQYAEPVKDTPGIIKAYNLLGWANMELEQYPDAIKWLKKALVYVGNPVYLDRVSVIYANTASCYNNISKPDSAFYFIDLALKYSRSSENLTSLANALNIRADMFINKKDYEGAEKDMKEALEVRQHIGEPLYIISDMAQLSSFYASTGQTDKGIEIAKNGIEIAKKANNLTKLIFLYTALGENYKRAHLMNEYSESLETIVGLKDSLYKNNSSNAIAEMGAKYELQKKENIIIKQKYALNRNRYIGIGVSAFFILCLLLFWALYRNYRLTQQRRMEMAMAEQKLLSYKAVEQAEEKERKRIAADLHDNLGSYAAAITANVKNLKEETSSNADLILAQLDENAQNMVTQLGDTIWVLKNEQLPITKLADRFKAWIQRLMQNYPQVKYHYAEHIVDDIEFTPAKILHIFLILKECVNNALKHSECTDLIINFFSEGSWVISIEDNGKGFDNRNINKGNGLANIKHRAAECGWTVEWKSIEPTGILVVISETNTK